MQVCRKRRTSFYYIRCVMRFRGVVVMFSSMGTRSKSSPLNFSLSLSIHCITVQSIRPAARSNERNLNSTSCPIFIRVIISNIDTARSSTVEKIEKYITNPELAITKRFISIFIYYTLIIKHYGKNISSLIFGSHLGNKIAISLMLKFKKNSHNNFIIKLCHSFF